MKKLMLAAIFAAALTGLNRANAQNSSTIIRGGINFANVSVSDDGRVDDAKMLTSFQVGILGDFELSPIVAIQPGLIFTGKGAKTQWGDEGSNTYWKATTNPYYVEVPVNLVFKAPLGAGAKFFVGAGPYIAAGVGGKNKTEGKVAGIEFSSEDKIEFSNDDPTTFNTQEGAGFNVMRRFDYGLNGTAGIEGKSLVLGVNYGYGLAKLQSNANSSADNNNKHRVLSVTLGFKL